MQWNKKSIVLIYIMNKKIFNPNMKCWARVNGKKECLSEKMNLDSRKYGWVWWKFLTSISSEKLCNCYLVEDWKMSIQIVIIYKIKEQNG